MAGAVVLASLVLIGSISVDGFFSAGNLKSILLLASFLGLASIGQTLVALVGGIDLSIAYVIGSANVLLVFLLQQGVGIFAGICLIAVAGAVIGALTGIASFKLQGQALVLSLGAGFVVVGLAQMLAASGELSTSRTGLIPDWLSNFSSANGTTFGFAMPPVVIFWVLLSILLSVVLKFTLFGRGVYAIGGNRAAARLAGFSERNTWVSVFAISGLFSVLTGVALLGFSGGAFVGVGEPYLFLTVAAVAVGGTSLLGGRGSYGNTVIGVLVLTVLKSLLVGFGFSSNVQQFVLGLLIVPLVFLYARNPSIRNQI
jgi:ribose transport system permease protein